MCIARKTLYSRVYFVCTHTKYMVSGDCTPGVCTAQICQVGNRTRCGGRVVCIARKTLYSRVYFVCTHTKYMVSGDCTPGVCTARICQVHTSLGCFHTNQHVKIK